MDFSHDVGGLLQLFDFSVGQDLLNNMSDTVGVQDTGEGQEDILVDTMFTLEWYNISIIQMNLIMDLCVEGGHLP